MREITDNLSVEDTKKGGQSVNEVAKTFTQHELARNYSDGLCRLWEQGGSAKVAV